MNIKSILSVGGLFSVFTIGAMTSHIDTQKSYLYDRYYYSDNKSKPHYIYKQNQEFQQNSKQFVFPDDELIFMKTPPQPKDNLKTWPTNSKLAWFTQNNEPPEWDTIKDKNFYTFAFEKDSQLCIPFDGKILEIQPDQKSGLISKFDDYFSNPDGAYILVESNVMYKNIEYVVQIKYCNISMSYQNFNQAPDSACCKFGTEQRLYYSDLESPITVKKGTFICKSGTTGTYTKQDTKTSYATINLKYKRASDAVYSNLTFKTLSDIFS